MATELVIKNILDHSVTNGLGEYVGFANKNVAFIFKSFTGLLSVNGISLASITTFTDGVEFTSSPHILSFEDLGSTWSVPTNYLAKYTISGSTYIVVFGIINSSGQPYTSVNTCGSDVTLSVEDASVPTSIYNCRLDGHPARSDCSPVSTPFALGGSYVQGEIPVVTS